MAGQEINHSANTWKGWMGASRMRTTAFYALSALLLIIFSFVIAFFIFKPKSSPIAETSTSGQILAWDIAQLVQTAGSSQQSNGLYAPGKGIFLYTLLAAGQNNAQISWAAAQLTPLAGRFAGLAKDEVLYWYITSADSGSQTLITVPFGRVGDAAYYESYQAPNQPMTASVTTAPTAEIPVETVPETAVTEPQEATPAVAAEPVVENLTVAFDVDAAGWAPLSGNWIAEDSVYKQKDPGGYDYITILQTGPLSNYTAEVDFLLHSFEMGPGFVYHLPNADNRAEGHLIDITDNGTAVRFAHYNEAGDFQYDGGAQIVPSLELETWHSLRLEVDSTTAVFYLDGTEIGRRDNTRTEGYVGLITSLSAVDFDNFRLTMSDAAAVTNQFDQQPITEAAPDPIVINNEIIVQEPQPEPEVTEPQPETTEPAAAQPSQLTRVFAANFDNGAVGWSPLSGTWLDENGVYAQNDAGAETAVAMIGSGVVENFIAETRFRGTAESGGAGLLFHVPQNNSPANALAIRLSADGQQLQWGRFDENNAFTVEAETAVPTPVNDENWHRLRLVVFGSQAVVYLDGQETAVREVEQGAGYVGLITAGAGMQFDDISVDQLPIQFTLSPGLALPVSDDFEDGNADGWQTNRGTWEIIANEYHQTAIGQFDLVAASPFQGNNYDITSRFRLVEGNLAAGFAFNMAARDNMAHSQLVSLTQQGTALQWGHFDGNGTFNYKGSASVSDVSDGGWHTMTLSVRRGRASVTIDDVVVADAIPLEYVSGYAGLFASDGHIAFDDVQINPAASLVGQLGAEEVVDMGLNFDDNGRAGLLYGPGQWQVADGKVSQRQLDQFDRFATLDVALAPNFRLSSDIHYVEGVMTGGLIFNMQRRDSRAESHMIAFANDGTYLQWGQFDINGNFVFLGGQDIGSVQNDDWHNLTVITNNGRFEVRLDDNTIATDIPLVYESGYAGLFGSNGWIEFDNVTAQGNGRRLTTEIIN